MIFLVTPQISPRLEYIASVLLGRLLGLEYRLLHTDQRNEAGSHPVLEYMDEPGTQGGFYVYRYGLLEQKGKEEPDPATHCIKWNVGGFECPVFFHTAGFSFPFDVFSASFYLLSRYEEYQVSETDIYHRFPHERSLAYRKDFLQIPLVNYWALALGKALEAAFPGLTIRLPAPAFQPTYDIDIAWSYRHKGLWRNLGGMLRQPVMERIRVLQGKEADPYDSYTFLENLHQEYSLKPLYFFLVAFTRTNYDKNIDPRHPAMRALIRRCRQQGPVGLHPSWQSHDYPLCLLKEKTYLEDVLNEPITVSRQHYIRFHLPQQYRLLTEAGIQHDYSMGYGSINGFRASMAVPYPWYDLEREQETKLMIHPFCFMDANSFFEEKQTTEQAAASLQAYWDHCLATGGTMMSIFHNQFLGNAAEFAGWKALYTSFIARVQQQAIPASSY